MFQKNEGRKSPDTTSISNRIFANPRLIIITTVLVYAGEQEAEESSVGSDFSFAGCRLGHLLVLTAGGDMIASSAHVIPLWHQVPQVTF